MNTSQVTIHDAPEPERRILHGKLPGPHTCGSNGATLRTVAIIGSGPSGLYAFKRLGESVAPLAITLYESGSVAGVGSPYDPALNDSAMLANIASVELPAVTRTLTDWMEAQTASRLAQWGIDKSDIDERAFYPRVLLGAYYADAFRDLVQLASDQGHRVTVLTERYVADVHAGPDSATIKSVDRGGHIALDHFDYVIMASGHQPRSPAGHSWDCADEPDNLYRQLRHDEWSDRRLGILGTSLSAIDAAIAVAADLGDFVTEGDSLRYEAEDPDEAFHLTLMSRRGVLPEIDFYCPIPYEPLTICTEAAIADAVQDGAPGNLDRVFDLFRAQLKQSDPAYARQISIDALDADTFAPTYFAARRGGNQLDWMRANLKTIEEHHSRQQTVGWKYAILRMHEPIGDVVAQFDESDRTRFASGLALIFIDNYAAIPPLSIKRLLALADAGRLDVRALGHDYGHEPRGDGGATITVGDEVMEFDRVLDARGQSALGPQDLPFPTLRTQIMANAQRGEAAPGDDIDLSGTLSLRDGVNAVSNVYCLSIPHLMRVQPFVQGLTSCETLGSAVADAVIARAARTRQAFPRDDLQALIEEVEQTSLIDCAGSGSVITVPRQTEAV